MFLGGKDRRFFQDMQNSKINVFGGSWLFFWDTKPYILHIFFQFPARKCLTPKMDLLIQII